MTTDDDRSDAVIEDPEWIKGLVAKALLQAAEDEDQPSAAPSATRPEPPEASRPDTAPLDPPPAAAPPLGPPPTAGAGSSVTPTDSGDGAAPLIVGRGFDDTPMLGDRTVSDRPVSDWPESTSAGFSSADRSVSMPPTSGPSATVTLEAEPMDREPVDLEAEPIDDRSGADDPVMVEHDATVDGFRSSDIRTVLEWLAVIVSALVVALLIKAFVLQAFWIPSPSMETTVNQGDRILVNKLSYRIHDVRRGDLVVFKKPAGVAGDTEDLIKRTIALPGETIEVREDGQIYIWGPGETPDDALLLEEPYLDPQNKRLAAPSSTDSLIRDIWDEDCVNQPRNPGRCTLGDNQFFMMGDNRNASSDSRTFGPITEDLIVGRAFLRIWPLGDVSSL